MANPEHVEIVRQGAEAIRKWREENPGVRFDLSQAILGEVNLGEANLSESNLSEVILSWANLSKANLRGATFSGAVLNGANLDCANLTGANLRASDLRRAYISGADLKGTDFSRANLAWANLSGAILNKASLSEADCCESDLRRADLQGTNLSGANLRRAYIIGADLKGADLSKANLSGANLSRANLSEADFGDADFDHAVVGRTFFGAVDLSAAKSLDTVEHSGPSTIGIDTLYLSKGKIPEVFLRGCGVPDALIGYLPTLLASQDFYSCFISYSHADEEFAKHLYSRMQQEHLRVWYAPEDIKGGRKLHDQIEEAIRVYDKLLLVLSEASMKSEWVKTEIRRARRREVKENRRILFPIRLVPFEIVQDWEFFDADLGKDSATEIREYFIPNFSNWKDHDSFEAGFKRLLANLKAEPDPRK